MIRVASLLVLAGCLEHVELGGDALPGLLAIDIAPADTTVSITLPSATQTVEYTATGHFVDGTTRDITADVHWAVDNALPGTFAHSLFTTTNLAAGHVTVRATNGDVAGTGALTVQIATTIVDAGFPPPDGASDLFAAGTTVVDMMKSPKLAYPADATRFPQGLAPVLVQYKRDPMTDAYRIAVHSDVLDLVVLTGTDRWRPDDATWALIAHSHLGTGLALEVDAAISTAPGTVYAGAPIAVAFDANDPGGALLYANKGLLRGVLGATSAAKLYPPAGDMTMIDAPSATRDGRVLAIAYGGHLRTIDAATATPIASTNVGAEWTAVSPDGARVVVARGGMVYLVDATTGAGIGSPDGHIALAGMATHPDWAPDGSALVVTIGTGVTKDDLKGGAITRIPYLGANSWGTPITLVASSGDNDNNYYPRWSPDGNWIAYVHADGPAKGAPTAELRLVAAAGGTPVPLVHASHQLALDPAAMNLANTMPAWAPIAGTAWLAFASARPYGVVRPMIGGSQIWIAAIMPDAAGDPSASALWLPAQDVTAVDDVPVWPASVVGGSD